MRIIDILRSHTNEFDKRLKSEVVLDDEYVIIRKFINSNLSREFNELTENDLTDVSFW